jgi:hypothetical protein
MRPLVLQRVQAICEYRFTRRQIVLAIRGPWDMEVVPAIAADVDKLAAQLAPRSIVVDFQDAQVLLTPEQLNATPATLSRPVTELPIAMVVNPKTRDLFREHAWHAAKLGLLRGVFSDQRDAQGWADRSSNSDRYSRTQVSVL